MERFSRLTSRYRGRSVSGIDQIRMTLLQKEHDSDKIVTGNSTEWHGSLIASWSTCFLDYSKDMGRRRRRVREKENYRTHLFPLPQQYRPSTYSPVKLIFNKATELFQISVLVYLPCVFFSISTQSPLVIMETMSGVHEKQRLRQSAQHYNQSSELGFYHSWTAAKLNQKLAPALFWIQLQKADCWSLQENI